MAMAYVGKNMAGWCWVQVHHDWHWLCRFGMRWVCELGDSSICLCAMEFSTKLCTDNFLWGFDVSFRTHDAAWSRAFDPLSKCWRKKASLPFQSLWCAAKSLLHHPSSISRLPKAVASRHDLSPKPPNHLAILGIAQAGFGRVVTRIQSLLVWARYPSSNTKVRILSLNHLFQQVAAYKLAPFLTTLCKFKIYMIIWYICKILKISHIYIYILYPKADSAPKSIVMNLWRKAAIQPGGEFHPSWHLPLHPTDPGPKPRSRRHLRHSEVPCENLQKADGVWDTLPHTTASLGRPFFASVTGWLDALIFRTSSLRHNSRDGSRVSQCCPSLLAHRPEWLRGGLRCKLREKRLIANESGPSTFLAIIIGTGNQYLLS